MVKEVSRKHIVGAPCLQLKTLVIRLDNIAETALQATFQNILQTKSGTSDVLRNTKCTDVKHKEWRVDKETTNQVTIAFTPPRRCGSQANWPWEFVSWRYFSNPQHLWGRRGEWPGIFSGNFRDVFGFSQDVHCKIATTNRVISIGNTDHINKGQD